MDVSEVIKNINYICLLISIFIFLVLKFLKYLISREQLKIKKSNSVFNSIEESNKYSPSPK
jgi:hypothetical protein